MRSVVVRGEVRSRWGAQVLRDQLVSWPEAMAGGWCRPHWRRSRGGRTESRYKLELRWQMGRGSICCSGTRQARSTCSSRRWPSPPPQGKDSWRWCGSATCHPGAPSARRCCDCAPAVFPAVAQLAHVASAAAADVESSGSPPVNALRLVQPIQRFPVFQITPFQSPQAARRGGAGCLGAGRC
jgi:hypothetical protein